MRVMEKLRILINPPSKVNIWLILDYTKKFNKCWMTNSVLTSNTNNHKVCN